MYRQVYLAAHHYHLPNGKRLTGRTFADVLAIHHFLFSDIYEWAGQLREVNMNKGGDDFFPFQRFPMGIADLNVKLADYRTVSEDAQEVGEALGDIISEQNFLHPFREGNGRTQRTFAKLLAYQKGFTIDLSPDSDAYKRYMEASIADDPALMKQVYVNCIRPIGNS
ncbi:hypothetical protein LH991_07840 [Schleiferilactobacillus harbinensis]|jgi:cell filamentation protein|uniref:protein adenylyltransferase n=2 Tax=Schleiferilactobacillus harbinensis TaxID=304207 RepID=A0A0R1XIV1_9LACO|nr:Fic family protein [Schleiferilactobacillus harbinensis]KRM30110.1 hypothetical protein FC91_GL002924 [Schleiferilactobacillus harbinensis DSM 16991]QFR63894.1 hypothetical protein LH991_07840 [Schleiferilactobacillus harbinensis]